MGKIIELDGLIKNQIAAGEVCEKPSSVLKELLENSIDAKAQNIEIRVKNAALNYLIITDDGEGMDENDLKMCTKRYATSKLKELNDLEHILSFGFRGEALSAISAVSKLKITSQKEAFFIEGVLQKLIDINLEKGTRIEIRDLFYNVPARLKFLPSNRIENLHIENIIKQFVFNYKDINFRFIRDDKLIFDTKNLNNSIERALLLFGEKAQGYIYEFEEISDFIKINGFLCAPLVTRKDIRGIYVMCNNRIIKDKRLEMAVRSAYRTLLEVGEYPICAINIHINPKEVDVNVHPRKAQVRFKDEEKVVSQVIKLLGKFLSSTPWLNKDWQAQVKEPADFSSFSLAPLTFSSPIMKIQEKLLKSDNFKALRFIGQIKNTYLLFEGPNGLIALDQHAAHERVMFEKIRKNIKNHPSLPLLISIPLEFESHDLLLLKEYFHKFKEIGIKIDFLGENKPCISEVPPFFKNANFKELVLDLLKEWHELKNSPNFNDICDNIIATMACHSAIRAGDLMMKEEVDKLLFELDRLDINAHCPHGRPFVKSFDEMEIKKWFHRG